MSPAAAVSLGVAKPMVMIDSMSEIIRTGKLVALTCYIREACDPTPQERQQDLAEQRAPTLQ